MVVVMATIKAEIVGLTPPKRFTTPPKVFNSVIMKQSMKATKMTEAKIPTGRPNLCLMNSARVKPSGQILRM